MSRIFGAIRQNGYVVRDIQAAMRHWAEVMGIGPWFYIARAPIKNFRCRGEPSELEVSIALANSGDLQLELIQQCNDAPSMYRDFLRAGREGLQHIAYWSAAFDADLARAEAAGFRVGQSGEVGREGRFVYFLNEAHPGSLVELSEVSGGKGRMFAEIAATCRDWDGTDPIRPFPARKAA